VLLDKLLPKLKDGGHKVLIFSQFKIMLKYVIWNEMPWQFGNCVQ
jgi:SNF2 family DNA or RNA helicase